jgi:hypothetical protein
MVGGDFFEQSCIQLEAAIAGGRSAGMVDTWA